MEYITKPVMVYSQRWMVQQCGDFLELYGMDNNGDFADEFTSFDKMLKFIEDKEKEKTK